MVGKKALITGITGQDGSYLAEFLLEKKYDVYGMIRRASSENVVRIRHIRQKLTLLKGELTDPLSLFKVVSEVKPDEIYNLGAMSFVKDSFSQPAYTVQVTGMGAVNLLEICKHILPDVRFYQASSSEIFGEVWEIPQKETTPFQPSSPYGYAKLLAHHHTRQCRQKGMFASCGILFNHESPRRGYEFVTRKITDGVARHKLGLVLEGKAPILTLGNLDSRRDWGYAREYVEVMWKILQHDKPDEFVVATGKQTTVRNFVRHAFQQADIHVEFKGSGIEEKGYDADTGDLLCQISEKYFRPVDVVNLLGDASKAKEILDWAPETDVETLAKLMVSHDLKMVGKEIDTGMIRKISN
ncbi:MAG: GDP-mannose 4,6-dehydratase [Candidatus Cloacimonetes bacterium 4572_55]|nr:MAG: GDP-mannose 4,6-dehydratase [Candidatus Cloacimonetes bacterium 4572_55]